ncbi:lytic transglycosylase domain-containing protein [Noviherbaspirillum pedocola]|uniref:Lytic transglycosylase domain-containing protein n=1 Tax=Noviherbaspirillum pedocola TaxID=2801341 RepID=A0A934SUR5_9BURK|nr:lytic transglycosylase domain-containing protein [Noviherbaspirillum pedocola]MBK4736087.1 lytic transglycosylase domain-containing protein [Noviherbaspirillum pedocola]
MKRLFAGAVLAATHFCAFSYDCFDAAGLYQHVHPGILRAISIRENVRCDGTVRRNSNGSIDVGCMQINSAHFEELAKYGIPPEALQNQCANIFIGAWHYAVMVKKYGNTWTAVGAYHSETPEKRDRYAAEVRQIYEKYQPWLDPRP